MPKVFQVLELNTAQMNETPIEELHRRNLPETGKSLVKKLKIKGYQVLEGSAINCGIPTSLIVIGEFPSPKLKNDFYAAIRELNIPWFSSGEVYFESLEEEKTKN